MSIYFYDKAVAQKLQRWIKEPNLVITSPDETRRILEYTADTSRHEDINLPLIALRRDPNIELKNTNKHAKTFDGAVIQANTNKVELLNVVPISITYRLDIYCRYQQQADEYARNFLFNLINYPKVTVEIPYNDSHIEHDSNITVVGELVDNSDIPERLFPGQFTRWTITFVIPDAYLFSVPIRDALEIETETTIKLENSSDMEDEVKLQ